MATETAFQLLSTVRGRSAGKMRGLVSILLLPLTVPGAMIGIVYALVTRRHPSAKLLILFGVIGLALLVAAIFLIWAGVATKVPG